MFKYICKRILAMIPMVFCITLASFILMQLAPGSPADMYQDPNKPEMSEAEIERIEETLGLNEPIHVQYFKWLNQLLHGNLGYSYRTFRPVISEMFRGVGISIQLNLWIITLSTLLGIAIGIFSALRQNTWVDHLISFLTFISMSVPTFWVAIMCILVFSIKLGWLPFIGLHDPLASTFTPFEYFIDYVKHLIMPIGLSTIMSMSGWIRYERASFIEVMNQDYIRTAMSKGLSPRAINWKHAFRNSCLPIVTMLAGTLAGLVSGSFLLETIFSIPGIGRIGTEAMQNLDYPMIMGSLLFSSLLVMGTTLLADILYCIVDPRIRFE